MTKRTELAYLTEGGIVYGVELSGAEAVALNATKLVSVSPAAAGWTVTASHVVGALRCGDLDVRVNPKVGQVQLLRLLGRAHGLSGLTLDQSLVRVEADTDLSAVLAAIFVLESRTALAAGPLRGYRTEDQTLNVMRGRLRFREQELRRFGAVVPLEVIVDEWTADTDENRRLRAAARRLVTAPGLTPLVRRELARIDHLLSEAWLVGAGEMLAPWRPTRLNIRLHRLLHLADLVLANTSVEHRVGDIEVHGYVLSLSWLFEKLVGRIFQEQAGPLRVLEQQTYPLADRDLTIRPDFVFKHGNDVIAVADTKYKVLDELGRFPNADAYQLVTYCARLGLNQGHLIYAAGESAQQPFDIIGTRTALDIHAVDLSATVADIEAQLAGLCNQIVNDAVGAGTDTIGRGSA